MIAGGVYLVYWQIHHWLMKSSGFRPSDEKVNLVPHGVEGIGAWVQKTMFRVCIREHGGSWAVDRAVGCSHPRILQESWAMCASEHDVSDHVVSKNTVLCPPLPPAPNSPHRPSVPAYTNTQQRHSKTAQLTLRVCCWLWPLPGSVGFTGSFTPQRHAWPHQRPWTLTLCAATEARGKNLLAHNTGISSACVSACICARVHAY